jgi:hypothetical protein
MWKIDGKALERCKLREGVYVLKTNWSTQSYPLAKTLAKYKEQSQVERRIHHLKGPLAVAPMFLKNPERMAGLLCILVWALRVMALMERQVRRSLKGKPLYGLYPENRPSPAPTGPALLDAFRTLCIVSVLLGNGNGTFQSAVNFAVGFDPSSVAVADVNGDGRPDLVVANTGSYTVSVLLGNGNGTF